jgi:hypothetical protein
MTDPSTTAPARRRGPLIIGVLAAGLVLAASAVVVLGSGDDELADPAYCGHLDELPERPSIAQVPVDTNAPEESLEAVGEALEARDEVVGLELVDQARAYDELVALQEIVAERSSTPTSIPAEETFDPFYRFATEDDDTSQEVLAEVEDIPGVLRPRLSSLPRDTEELPVDPHLLCG